MTIFSEPLHGRLRDIAELLLNGVRQKEIGFRLEITHNTVKSNLSRLYRRFAIPSDRVRQVALAILLHEHRGKLGLNCNQCDF